MEFKFRAVDDNPPMYVSPPSSSITYFCEQALRAGYSNTDPRQIPELMRNAMLWREIQKEKIREEIIAEEIMRRRVLEAEVRRELMMEREMAMRGGGGGGRMSFQERMTMRLDSGLPFPIMSQFDYCWLEERLAFHGRGVFNMFPPLPWLPEAVVAPGMKSASEDKKDNLIVLTKPDPNICGAKRKAGTPPAGGAGEHPFAGLKKKPKEEWSCALCQVSATSEKGLNEHLQGKKHKAKEAGLRAQKTGKSPGTAPLPKKTAKPAKDTSAAGSELEGKVEESIQVNNSDDDSYKKTENKIDVLPVQKNQHVNELKKNGAATMQREERTREFRRKKFKFCCEMCQIGAYSEVVMDAHKKGKKHLARLQELGQNGENRVPAITAVGPLVASKKAEDSEVMTEEAIENKAEIAIIDNGKTTENTIVDADGSGQYPLILISENE